MERRWNPRLGVSSLGVLAALTLWGSALAGTPQAKRAALPDGRTVIARFVEAVGGEARIRSHTSSHWTGAFESPFQALRGKIDVFAARSNRYLAKLQLEGCGDFLSGFDGAAGWRKEPFQDPVVLAGAEFEELRDEAEFFRDLYDPATYPEIETLAMRPFEDRPCYELRVRRNAGPPGQGKEWLEYFDAETALRVARVSKGPDAVTWKFSDYRDFGGIKTATRQVQSRAGRTEQILTIASVSYDRVASSTFDRQRYWPVAPRLRLPPARKHGLRPADAVDRIVLREMRERSIPGLSLAVLRNGRILKAEGYGLASVEPAVPARRDTIYQIASTTKMFTATGVMRLVQEGKVRLDEPISHSLAGLPEAWRGITVRQLLNHTSGLPREAKGWIWSREYSDEETIAAAARFPLRFPPGDGFQYSNVGYYLLGMLIHKVTGKPWHEYLRERFFRPLGMSRTRWLGGSEPMPARAAGYQIWKDARVKRGPSTGRTGAEGALPSCATDLAKWDAALYTDKILARSSRALMWAPGRLKDGSRVDYGFGYSINRTELGTVVGHGGDDLAGFRSRFRRFVDDDTTVILLCNGASSDPEPMISAIARSMRGAE